MLCIDTCYNLLACLGVRTSAQQSVGVCYVGCCCCVLQPLVAMLKVKLGAFGWAEAVRRDAKESQWKGGAAAAAAELDAYLERMGVK